MPTKVVVLLAKSVEAEDTGDVEEGRVSDSQKKQPDREKTCFETNTWVEHIDFALYTFTIISENTFLVLLK